MTGHRLTSRAIGVALFTLAALMVLAYFLSLSGVRLKPVDAYRLKAVVPSALGLAHSLGMHHTLWSA